MANKTKLNLNLHHIVSDFEIARSTGTLPMLNEQTFVDLIDYYETEMQLENVFEVADMAINQYQYRAEFYLLKARLLFKHNRVKECLKILDTLDVISPEEFDAKILKAKVLAVSGDKDEAFKIIKNLIDTSAEGDILEVRLCQSYLYEWMSDYEEMFQKLKQTLLISPENPEALERIWAATELSKNYEESILLHKVIINKNPYNCLAWFNLGHAYASVGEYNKAIFALEYSFIVDDDFELGYVDCAEICFQEKDYKKALSIYNEYIEKFGSDSEILLNIGQCHLHLKNYFEAKIHLDKAIKIDQYNDEAYYLLAKCHINEKSWNKALKALFQAMKIDDHREEYYQSLARVYVSLGEFDHAKINYKKAAEIGLEQASYWEEYISFLIKIDNLVEARKVVYQAEQYTYSDKIEYCKAAVFFKLQNRKRGMLCLEEALTDSPENFGFFIALCPEIAEDKEIKAAIKYYLTTD